MFEVTYGTVNFFLTESSYNELQEKLREEEEERKAWEEDRFFFNQLQEVHKQCLETDDPMLWDIYSDLYKDYWGVRPH